MSPRPGGQTQRCSQREALTRRAHAGKFLEVAELVASEESIPESASVSAALAVLAGIAASDAACCRALARRHRGADHRQATRLVAQIERGGTDASSALGRLLDLKDEAHYGMFSVSAARLRTALRQARALVQFADEVLSRPT